jgi:hydroxyethylthiazole kinase-like uncharacterized protein yjeF
MLRPPLSAVPRRVLGTAAAWPLHASAALRQAEAAAQAAQPPHTLMQRAGLALARLVLALTPHAQRLLVLAGPGNNGGDGLEATPHLLRAGKAVQLVLLGDAARLPPDAAAALQRAQAAGLPIDTAWPPRADAELAIDALLGLGATRAPDGALAQAIAWLNGSGMPVLSVDLPSGLHPDTGALLGAQAVRATHTLSLLALKPGLFTAAGRDHAGEVWLDTLGVDVDPLSACAELAGAPTPRTRRHAEHKGSFGDVLVIGGAPGMAGAAWLAGRAALAAGAGRVHLRMLDPAAATLDAGWPELMVASLGSDDRALPATATVVCGCGGADQLAEPLGWLLHRAPRLLLDADALNTLAGDTQLQTQLAARTARGQASVLTPHPLEAARLLGCGTADVQADRLGSAQALAQRFACCVLLKGSGSITAAPGSRPLVNPSGNALLASAGTGDVLAGWIAGLWSQAHPAATAHGQAADRAAAAGRTRPLRAASLVDALLAG